MLHNRSNKSPFVMWVVIYVTLGIVCSFVSAVLVYAVHNSTYQGRSDLYRAKRFYATWIRSSSFGHDRYEVGQWQPVQGKPLGMFYWPDGGVTTHLNHNQRFYRLEGRPLPDWITDVFHKRRLFRSRQPGSMDHSDVNFGYNPQFDRMLGIDCLQIGWPLRWLWCVDVSYGQEHELVSGIVINETTRSLQINNKPTIEHKKIRVFPVGIHWDRAGVSVTLFATVIALVHQTVQGSRNFWRRSRNRCPDCGYHVHGLSTPGCPECGWRRAD